MNDSNISNCPYCGSKRGWAVNTENLYVIECENNALHNSPPHANVDELIKQMNSRPPRWVNEIPKNDGWYWCWNGEDRTLVIIRGGRGYLSEREAEQNHNSFALDIPQFNTLYWLPADNIPAPPG